MMIDYTLPLDQLPDPLPIVPLEKPFDVTITPPGSKSITNRAYVLAALAEGESRIIRPLRAEDTDLLLEALCTLGAEARWEGDDVLIRGVGGRFPRGGSVYLGDGGTPTRFMIAAACLAAEPVIVDGSKRMRERPIAESVEMLRQLGARIEYVEEEGRLPVRVVPSESFKGGELRVGKTASSQFVSAVMLVAPWLPNGVVITFDGPVTSWTYVALTATVMEEFDVFSRGEFVSDADPTVRAHVLMGEATGGIEIQPEQIQATRLRIEADASSALYWCFAAALVPGAKVTIDAASRYTNQPDGELILYFSRCGSVLEPVSGGEDWIRVTGTRRLLAESFNGSLMPDGVMAYAVAASRARGTSTITGLHTLRVKETDRLAALANELRKVGCEVETTEDSITITPGSPALGSPALRAGSPKHGSESRGTDATHGSESRGTNVVIETYNDHRMAMSFAILGLVRPGISIRNPKCVAKSYPTFWKDFAKLYG